MKAIFVAAGAAALAGGAIAQQTGIMDRAINKPSIAYTFYGVGQSARVVRDAEVAGSQAYRVDVAQKTANAYDIGANAPIIKPIHKGDRIVMAIWMRAPKLAADATTPIPFLGVTGPAPAYAQLASGTADVGPAWKLYNARGTAGADFAGGQANVTIHLGAAKAEIDLGPVFVLDLGPKAQAAPAEAGAPAAATGR